MPESCPEMECRGTLHEHFIKVYESLTSDEHTFVSQGYWCPRCRKWYDWQKVQCLVEKRYEG